MTSPMLSILTRGSRRRPKSSRPISSSLQRYRLRRRPCVAILTLVVSTLVRRWRTAASTTRRDRVARVESISIFSSSSSLLSLTPSLLSSTSSLFSSCPSSSTKLIFCIFSDICKMSSSSMLRLFPADMLVGLRLSALWIFQQNVFVFVNFLEAYFPKLCDSIC